MTRKGQIIYKIITFIESMRPEGKQVNGIPKKESPFKGRQDTTISVFARAWKKGCFLTSRKKGKKKLITWTSLKLKTSALRRALLRERKNKPQPRRMYL